MHQSVHDKQQNQINPPKKSRIEKSVRSLHSTKRDKDKHLTVKHMKSNTYCEMWSSSVRIQHHISPHDENQEPLNIKISMIEKVNLYSIWAFAIPTTPLIYTP